MAVTRGSVDHLSRVMTSLLTAINTQTTTLALYPLCRWVLNQLLWSNVPHSLTDTDEA